VLNSYRVMTFPEEDADFAKDVNHALGLLGRSKETPQKAIAELVQWLLPRYPRLAIHQRDGLASFESEPKVWYAFRDGSYNGPADPNA
jgi:hypothetical protein